MWRCECGEFNNDEHDFCVTCKRVRVEEEIEEGISCNVSTLEVMFRRVQDFILIDIALLAIIALYCFLAELKEAVPIVVLLLFQIILVTNLLRMLYQAAMTSERNSIFLHKIHKLLLEQRAENENKEEKNGGPAAF